MACGPYDRFEALRSGVVRPEGIDLTYLAMQSPPEIFAQMVKKGSFDISEMSASMYMTLRARQGHDFPFIAIPVFPLRMFRHGYIFVNQRSGIKTPRDLEGKRVGVPEYRQTAAVWIRGLLQHEYGVSVDTFQWYEGGANKNRGHDPVMDLRPEKKVSIQTIGETKTLNQMLAVGELDALVGARRPDCLGSALRLQDCSQIIAKSSANITRAPESSQSCTSW